MGPEESIQGGYYECFQLKKSVRLDQQILEW